MQLNDYIAERRRQKKLLVMTHVVCGYPSFEDNWRELEIMAGHGVDLVELQFPFSEPSADGPLFVKANQESLALAPLWSSALRSWHGWPPISRFAY